VKKEILYRLFLALKKNSFIVFISLILLSSVLFVWSAYDSRYIINPDGVSYISIATQYSNGQFSTAVNSTRSPVLSWLMAPLILFGLDGQVAFWVVNFLITLSVLALGMYLVWHQTKRLTGAILFWATATPFLIYAIGAFITPDLLVVAWVMLFWLILIRLGTSQKLKSLRSELALTAIIGLVGTLGYLTKQYLLPFFIATILFWSVANAIYYRNKQWVRMLAFILIFMVIFSVPWAAAMSAKYNKFTIGSFLSVNVGSSSTDTLQKSSNPHKRYPAYPVRLQPPLNSNAVSIWEDKASDTDSSKSSNGHGIKFYAAHAFNGLPQYLKRISSLWVLTLPIIILLYILFAMKKLPLNKNYDMALTAALFAIYFLGYAGLVSKSIWSSLSRYLWPLLFLSLLAAGLYFSRHIQLKAKPVAHRILIALALMALPVSMIIQYREVYADLLKPAREPAIRMLANELKQEGIARPGVKISSNNRRHTIYLAYYLQGQSYGTISPERREMPNFSDPIVQNALRKYHIDLYINFESKNTGHLDLTGLNVEVAKVFNIKSLSCQDFRGSPFEPCRISVIKLIY
jgi:hypothetical protein